jgi:hypothetical protein
VSRGVAASPDEQHPPGVGVQVSRAPEEVDPSHSVELLGREHQRDRLTAGGKGRQPAQGCRGGPFGDHAVVAAEAAADVVRERREPCRVVVCKQQDGNAAKPVLRPTPGSTHRFQRTVTRRREPARAG